MTRHLKSSNPPPASLVIDDELMRRLRDALEEDLGSGDVTTEATIPASALGEGRLVAKAEGILCGVPIAEQVWKMISPSVEIAWHFAEGAKVSPGDLVAEMTGSYRALIVGERLALNLLQRLSGVATLTRRMVDRAILAAREAGCRAPDVCDTRKTTPLWRKLERYAVRAGGGVNHRFGLFDMVLIKENHVRAAGGLGQAIRQARAEWPDLQIGAEARDAEEAAEAAAERPDLILLDNMMPDQIVRILARFAESGIPFEASGGIDETNISDYARTGVDRVSCGSLTHSARALDLSLQLYDPSHGEVKS